MRSELRMTLLAPEIVEGILAGRQSLGLTMARAMQPFPREWQRQRLSREQYPKDYESLSITTTYFD
jgi:hypothetical protein